jgi:hypothetical protein
MGWWLMLAYEYGLGVMVLEFGFLRIIDFIKVFGIYRTLEESVVYIYV